MSSVSWVKPRKPMRKYPKTPQQKKVKVGGELIKVVCTGKKGTEFRQCRVEVLQCAFDDKKCNGSLLEKKNQIVEELT
jgi:hypothetical protein